MAIKWGTMIPLAGGMSIGMERAVGAPPSGIFSFEGFHGNDQHYLQWLEQNGHEVPYHVVNDEFQLTEEMKGYDIINTVCPCAGLSLLNTSFGKTGSSRGADAKQNNHMYNSANFVLEKLQPKVLWGENAPALYGSVGAPVAARLYEIGKKNGYSFSIIKTNTNLHGIPQNRPRTFYFFWKSKYAPVLNYHQTEAVPLHQYLKEIPKEASAQGDHEIPKGLHNHYTYRFMVHKYGKKGWRKAMMDAGCTTVYGMIRKFDLLQELHTFVHKIDCPKGITHAHRMIEKFARGKGVWDSSIHYDKDQINAVISRNMGDYVHPTEERRMNVREFLHLMGHPHEYELVEPMKNFAALSQNVPVCTAKTWSGEVIKFVNGELPFSTTDFLKQNNVKRTIDTPGVEVLSEFALDNFLEA